MIFEWHTGEDPECYWVSWNWNLTKYKIKCGFRVEKQTIYILPMVNASWPPGIFGTSVALAVFCFTLVVFDKKVLGMV